MRLVYKDQSGILTFQQGSLGVSQIGSEKVGILGRDDGVLRTTSINSPLAMTKLVQVLTDMP